MGLRFPVIRLTIALCTLQASVAFATFNYGDLFVTDFDSFTGGRLLHYNASGSLVQTTNLNFTATATGNAITPDGLVAVPCHNPSTLALYGPSGTLSSSFVTPEVANPKDVSVFPDGVFSILDGGGKVEFYSSTGTHLRSVAIPNLGITPVPFGSAVDTDGSLLVTDFASSRLLRLSESGTILASMNLLYTPFDLAVDPSDGTYWATVSLSGADEVLHLSHAGSTLSSFSISTPSPGSIRGIALGTDGNLFVSANSTLLWRYSRTGTLLQTLSVPAVASLESMSVYTPEPTGASALIGFGAAFLCRRKKRNVVVI